MRQHFPFGFAVTYEIVVNEIDHGRMAGPCQHGIEFGCDLFRRLESGLATVERGNITEFATIRTATGELQAADEVTVELDQIIGGQRELRKGKPLARLKSYLCEGWCHAVVKAGDEAIGGVADFPDVEIIEFRIEFGSAGNGCSAEYN